jgi:enamine deaminase RidA (YjgF/YER057c/UK114 family)
MASNPSEKIRRVSSPQVPEPAAETWSNCLVVNGIAYVAGMIARGEDGKILDGDEYAQAKMIFAKFVT